MNESLDLSHTCQLYRLMARYCVYANKIYFIVRKMVHKFQSSKVCCCSVDLLPKKSKTAKRRRNISAEWLCNICTYEVYYGRTLNSLIYISVGKMAQPLQYTRTHMRIRVYHHRRLQSCGCCVSHFNCGLCMFFILFYYIW